MRAKVIYEADSGAQFSTREECIAHEMEMLDAERLREWLALVKEPADKQAEYSDVFTHFSLWRRKKYGADPVPIYECEECSLSAARNHDKAQLTHNAESLIAETETITDARDLCRIFDIACCLPQPDRNRVYAAVSARRKALTQESKA